MPQLVELQQILNEMTIKMVTTNKTITEMLDVASTNEPTSVDASLLAVQQRKVIILLCSLVDDLEAALNTLEAQSEQTECV